MMIRLLSIILVCITFASQPVSVAAQETSLVREYRKAHEHQLLEEFTQLLSIPNVTSDRVNIRRNADALMQMLERRGLSPRLLEATGKDAPPAVYGELRAEGATRTLVFYAHYDGQPTDPKQWTGSLPWQPVLRSSAAETGGQILSTPKRGEPINPEWRLYARSASDDKAGVMAVLAALDALKATGQKPTSNIKIFFEGEEEAGSPHLADILRRHQELLHADAWIIFDGPVHQSGRKQVVFGVRGVTSVDITVFGARRPLHSGHYGNWAPNPALLLSRLLASMKDETGRVLIHGFYDDVEPLGEIERRAIADAPQFDAELQKQLGFAVAEGAGKSLLEQLQQPSLNIDGISSAEVGTEARNVIPTTATATLDLRLVKGNDHRRQVARLVNHIRQQGFHVTEREPTDEERRQHPRIAQVTERGGYNASRTRMDLPISLKIIEAVQSVSSQPVVKLPTLGGSLPLYILHEILGAPSITVPLANYDNNQHAENENIRLQNLWDGIEIVAAIMTMKQ
ncbi:MAG TPA: M20/M25/M40 family metallo-hydrolase [Pyrinomonadaceae bacterium]|jgi:acetylornithine deacetylase/succinyl-diaminopimelate desuccinylase-like protein